ncbi:30S ribosomal protein S6 [bacterium]|nr:MAG: 30S ribosomal protein S6 [bacterium]
MNNIYELTYIIPGKVNDTDVPNIQAKVDAILVENGGKSHIAENMFTVPQKKKMSYEIEDSQFGYYVTVYFNAEPEAIEKISKSLDLNNDVLRFLIISIKGEIPQGVVVSKKDPERREVAEQRQVLPKSKEVKESPENKEVKKEKVENSHKTSLDNLDKKLDEILGE